MNICLVKLYVVVIVPLNFAVLVANLVVALSKFWDVKFLVAMDSLYLWTLAVTGRSQNLIC
jgi:hypothetical protein